jgi:hypothetical protein
VANHPVAAYVKKRCSWIRVVIGAAILAIAGSAILYCCIVGIPGLGYSASRPTGFINECKIASAGGFKAPDLNAQFFLAEYSSINGATNSLIGSNLPIFRTTSASATASWRTSEQVLMTGARLSVLVETSSGEQFQFPEPVFQLTWFEKVAAADSKWRLTSLTNGTQRIEVEWRITK